MATRPEGAPRNPEEHARWGCVVLLFGWLCLLGLGVALAARDVAERYAPVVVGAVVLFLAAKAAADALRRWANAPLLPVATSAGAVLVAVALCAVARDAVGAQLAELGETSRVADVLAGERLSASRALAVASGMVLLPMVGAAVGMGLARALGRPTLARWLGRAALAATGLGALLVLLAGIRSLVHPTIDDELRRLHLSTETLPAPGVPRDIDVRDARGRPLTVKTVMEPGSPGLRRTSLLGLTVLQLCETDGCHVGVLDGADAPALPGDVPDPAPFQRWDEAMLVTRDMESDTLYLRPQGGRVRAELHHVHGLWVPMGFSARDIAGRSAPPRSWLLAGLLGLAVVAALQWRNRAAKKRAAALDTAAAGVLGEDGWIALEGGETARLDGQAPIPTGPVVVLGSRAANSAYRDRPLSARDVLSGTLAEHRAKALLGHIVGDAALLAAGVLSVAPLAAAVPAGLVVPLGGGARDARGEKAALPAPRAPHAEETLPHPAPGQSWHFRAVDVVDVNHDGTDDAIGDCQLPHTNVSGYLIEPIACAIDGKTMRRIWLGPSSGIGGEGLLARAGDRAVIAGPGDRVRTMDVSTGKAIRAVELSDRGRDTCVPDAEGSVMWLGWPEGAGATLDVRSGLATPAPRPSSCASPWISACAGGLSGLCGSAPTVGETVTLEEGKLTPVAVLRTATSVLVVANKAVPERGTRPAGPVVAALDRRTSALLWQVNAARDGAAGESNGAAAVIGGVLFVSYATEGGHVAAFDARTGLFLWDFTVSSYASRSPWSFLVSKGRVYVPTSAGLAVLNADNGTLLGTMDGT